LERDERRERWIHASVSVSRRTVRFNLVHRAASAARGSACRADDVWTEVAAGS
jgi:hypothetical protein